jgi:hypothetical protein
VLGRNPPEHYERRDAVVDSFLLATGGNVYRPQSRRPRTVRALGAALTFSDAAPGAQKLNNGNAGGKREECESCPAGLPRAQMT